jgi:hypothetical protein
MRYVLCISSLLGDNTPNLKFASYVSFGFTGFENLFAFMEVRFSFLDAGKIAIKHSITASKCHFE